MKTVFLSAFVAVALFLFGGQASGQSPRVGSSEQGETIQSGRGMERRVPPKGSTWQAPFYSPALVSRTANQRPERNFTASTDVKILSGKPAEEYPLYFSAREKPNLKTATAPATAPKTILPPSQIDWSKVVLGLPFDASALVKPAAPKEIPKTQQKTPDPVVKKDVKLDPKIFSTEELFLPSVDE